MHRAGILRCAAGAAAVAIALAAAGCGGDGGASSAAGTTGAASPAAAAPEGVPRYRGGRVIPPRPAPPLRLRDHGGAVVDLRDLRGRPVLVSFVYATCPDVCPLLMSAIRQARDELGDQAHGLAVLAVSLDPAGDSPEAVREFLARHRMEGEARYLVGDRAELEPVWARWGIEVAELHAHDHADREGRAHDAPEGVHPSAGDIAHTSLTYGVTAAGLLTTAYPAGFPGADIAHDVPLLARS